MRERTRYEAEMALCRCETSRLVQAGGRQTAVKGADDAEPQGGELVHLFVQSAVLSQPPASCVQEQCRILRGKFGRECARRPYISAEGLRHAW